MKKIIEKVVDESLLFREVNKFEFLRSSLTERSYSKADLASFLISIYSFDLLKNKSIRHILLASMPLKVLHEIARELNAIEKSIPYDQALILSSISWSKSSGLPDLLNSALLENYGLEIPIEYYPFESQYKRLPVETIVAEKHHSLFDFQLDLSIKLLNYLKSESNSVMLQMPTGTGKTRTTMSAIITYLLEEKKNKDKSYVIWLAHTEELCEQAINTFSSLWSQEGSGTKKIFRFYGNYHMSLKELTEGSIVFGSLQKFHSLSKKQDECFLKILKNARILIFDEAHMALAPTYHGIIKKFIFGSNKCQLIGLSATPGRSSKIIEENKRLAAIFNNNLITTNFDGENTIDALRKKGILSNIIREEVQGLSKFELSDKSLEHLLKYLDLPNEALKTISKDPKRNKLIIGKITELSKQNIQSLVFSCSVDHAKYLSAMLNIRGINSGSITSDMRHSTRAKSIQSFRDGICSVLVNYGILSTGFDVPNIGAIIITRPTSSIVLYNQMIGRGLRGPKVGGNEECRLIDVKDNIIGFGQQNEMYDHFSGYWN